MIISIVLEIWFFLVELVCSVGTILLLLRENTIIELSFNPDIDYVNTSFYCLDYVIHLQYSSDWLKD